MTREEHLEYCKTCKLKSFNPQKGVVCSLTKEIADFEYECKNYQEDENVEINFVENSSKRAGTKKSKMAVPILLGVIVVTIFIVFIFKKSKQNLTKEVPNLSFYEAFDEDDCIRFGEEIESTIWEGDASFLDGSIDYDYLEDLIARRASLKEFERPYIKKVLKQKIRPGDEMVQALGFGGNISFRKYYKLKEKPHVVFRLFYNQSILYIDFELGKKGDEIVIRDAYNYVMGDTWTEVVSEALVETIERGETENSYSSAGYNNTLTYSYNKYKEVLFLIESGDYKEGLRVFESIPEEGRIGRNFDLTEIKLYGGLDLDMYVEKVDEYIKKTSDDQRFVAMQNMLKYCTIGNVIKTKKQVSRLNSHVNDDPVLNYYIGLALVNNRQFDEARIYLDQFIENYPMLMDGYWALIQLHLRQGDIPATVNIVEEMYLNFNLVKEELDQYLLDYKDLRRSKDYKDFYKRYD